ncbi:hypothetical protein LCGC14_2964820 [marine sediment metagenome]|uniref:Uncharacterized protein n=1 Tax=marine sediment metagenome TaxID=412755 RepID=A0A0F8XYN5_9ZZZZ
MRQEDLKDTRSSRLKPCCLSDRNRWKMLLESLTPALVVDAMERFVELENKVYLLLKHGPIRITTEKSEAVCEE